MRTFLAFFVARPLLVNLTMVFVLAAGVSSLYSAVFSAFPDFDFGVFDLLTQAPGRSPEDVELGVTAPLEEELLKVDGVRDLMSKSVEGYSAIVVTARDEASSTELEDLERDLQRAVDRASARLPRDLPDKPVLTVIKPGLQPVIELMVAGDVAEELLREIAQMLQDELREVPGVAGVDKRGSRSREIRILLDPLKLHQLGITQQEIEQAIRARNVTESGGALESYVAEKDIIAVGRFRDPKEVGDVIIRAPDFGNVIRIRDVAEVVADYEDWSVRSYINGLPGIYLGVRRSSDANEIAVVERVRERVAQIGQRLPPGVHIVVVNELSRMTTAMLSALTQNGLAGMAMVFLVLLLFFPWRAALWVAAGMPVAILMGFALMPLFGLTVNQFTLAATILMLGLLVDDAVVTSESISRHYALGMPPRQAAIEGTAAIAPAVITGAATTLLAFTPLVFLGGKEGKFMWMLPVMVMLIVTASLLECKLLLPCHIADAFSHRRGRPRQSAWFGRVEQRFQRDIAWLLRRRYRSLLLLTAVFAGIVVVGFRTVSVDLYPDADVDQIHIRAQLPAGSSFEHTYRELRRLEQYVQGLIDPRDLQNTRLTVGSHDIGRPEEVNPGSQSDRGLIDIFLQPPGVRQVNTLALTRRLRQELQQFKQFEHLAVLPKDVGPPVGFPVEVQVISNGVERGTVASELLDWLARQRGVTESWSSYEPGKDTIDLQLRHEAIAAYGLTVADITRAIRVAFDGYIVDELQVLGERVRYRLQLASPYRGDPQTLRSLTIINREGARIPLRALVDYRVIQGESAITHHFGKRVETLYAEIDRDVVSVLEINQALTAFIASRDYAQRFPALRLRQSGELSSQQATLGNMASALGVILMAIFIIMVLLFNSLTQPLIVLVQVPLGFAGVLIAFIVQGFDLSVPAMMGFLGLAGVLVNSAIVLIDRINQYRRDGLVAEQDIAAGAAYRLRPILVTSLTTIAGLAPAAYGWLGSNPFLTPMIMAMLWGIAFGTLITLLYVPCLYAVEQDLRRRLRRALPGTAGR